MNLKIFTVIAALLITTGAFATSNDFWLELARAFFESHCELVDHEQLENGQTAYYLACIW